MNVIEQALKAGAEWMEANKNHPDAQSFGCVAAAVADLARIAYGDKKETAGDAAVCVNCMSKEGTLHVDGGYICEDCAQYMSDLAP